MSQRILILQGHPDASETHLCHALAEHYCEGAYAHGHEVRLIDLASLEFPLLRSQSLSPVRETLIGGVETMSEQKRNAWFRTLHELGGEAK